jgi:hypothetical protein
MTPILGLGLTSNYPTQTPGALGLTVAPLIVSRMAELLIQLSSSVNGLITAYILRWDGVGAWWPVSPELQLGIQLQPQTIYPAESVRRTDPPLTGHNRFVLNIESPGYYVVFFPTAKASDITSMSLNELFPQSGSFSAGAQVRGALPSYAAPVAANTTGIHAAVLATAANDFVGPFGVLESWGRNLQVTFAAMWDGGDIVITGTDQITGQAITETISALPGSTVLGLKVFRTVTAIRKTAVGVAAAGASVGIGPALGVPFSFSAGQEFVNGVAELATALNTGYYSFTPATAANGVRNYNFIGW